MTSKIIFPKKEYEKNLKVALQYAQKVVLTDEEYYYRKNYSKEWAEQKEGKGRQYIIDNNYMAIRSENGHMGQRAVEKLLGVEFTDPDTSYNVDKNKPDLLPIGLHVGVKTHRKNNAPMIEFLTDELYNEKSEEEKKKNRYPQIIVTKDDDCNKTFYILGVYSPAMLWYEDYIEKQLIYDIKLYERGTKTIFFGVHRSHPFSSLEELKKIIGPKWITSKPL